MSLFFSLTGFKKSAILSTIYWGLLASSGVCLHGSHAALSTCFHHDLHHPPQVSKANCWDIDLSWRKDTDLFNCMYMYVYVNCSAYNGSLLRLRSDIVHLDNMKICFCSCNFHSVFPCDFLLVSFFHSVIRISRNGWHTLLNFLFHTGLTFGVFAGGINQINVPFVCQIVSFLSTVQAFRDFREMEWCFCKFLVKCLHL